MSNIGPRAVQTLKCLSSSTFFTNFFNNTFEYRNAEFSRIYSDEVLQKYVNCVSKENTSDLQSLIKKYVQDPTLRYLFLLHVYNQAFSKDKEFFIPYVLTYLDKDPLTRTQECVCSNKDDDTLSGDTEIKNVPLKELYLLPSGRCIRIDELIMHLELSSTKFLDPTSPKGVKDKLWENGWDMQKMLESILNYTSSQGPEMYARATKIKNDFDLVLNEYVNKVSSELKTLLEETYYLFYFAEGSKEQVKEMLEKYKYPDLENYDKDKVSELFSGSSYGWQEAYNDDISQFRSLLGFKIGYKILEEIPPEEKEAILFIGEWAGMAREGWGALTSGTFCTKTYGSLVHRMSDILEGTPPSL